MNEIDWSRSSGAASVGCGLLGLVWCPGPMILGGLVFGILGKVLSPGRGYTTVAIVGLSLCFLNIVLYLYHVQLLVENFPGETLEPL